MAETRVQVAFHFKADPAQLTPGAIRLPEMITRTISVGDQLITEKVAIEALPAADRAALIAELDKQVREATRTAKPAGSAPEGGSDWQEKKEEMSAF